MGRSRMRVRLLGSVDVVVGGIACPVPGLRRRAVLAALALRSGEVVSVDLWRGRPLADLAGLTWFDDDVYRLEHLLLQVRIALIETRLALGGHLRLITELEDLIRQHPLNELLHGQLMLALYRSGRQGEALAAYQRVRRTLDDELGVTPGRVLGDTSGPASMRIAIVSGTAGIGKTTLAVAWGHRAVPRFPDGQLYVDLRGFDPTDSVVDPSVALRGFVEALGVPPERIPASPEGQVALYRSLLAGKRILVILDNARDADQVRPLLPGSPGCAVVVTSRGRQRPLVACEGGRPVILDLLSAEEAHDLLSRRLGADRVAAEPAAAADIITRCARLPLALVIVAARAGVHPTFTLATLAGQLGDAAGTLDSLHAGDAGTDMRLVFSWSYRALGAGARRLFRLLGLHPGPDIGLAAAASLAGLPIGVVQALLAELADAHLLAEHRPRRYAGHDLLRAYAAELADHHDSETERALARRRMFDHYVHTAHAAAVAPCRALG
jgi:Bacterial transcriptional activator domain/NB-ARC domain